MDSDAAGSSRPRMDHSDGGVGSLCIHPGPDWAALDPYLRPLRDWHDDDTSAALAYASTSSGDRIGVSLMAAAPPMTSYLLYQWIPDEGGPSSNAKLWDAKAVAAHRNSILLRFLLPTGPNTFPGKSEELFVYQPPPRRTLLKLPTCRRHHFMNSSMTKNTGILLREDGSELVAAHLSVTPGMVTAAELCCLFGDQEPGSWRTTKCEPICHDQSELRQLAYWETDTVVSFGDFICWVDYFRGMLVCDVWSPDPEVRYVPLPGVKPYPGRCHPHLHIRGIPATYRSVCVTSRGGGVKFVDVTPRDVWFRGRGRPRRRRPAFSSWALTTEEWLWVKDAVVTHDEFLDLTINRIRSLPCSLFECPLVDMVDPDTIYFALLGGEGVKPRSSCLIAAVHMKSRTIDTISCEIGSHYADQVGIYNNTSSNLYYHEAFLSLILDATDH